MTSHSSPQNDGQSPNNGLDYQQLDRLGTANWSNISFDFSKSKYNNYGRLGSAAVSKQSVMTADYLENPDLYPQYADTPRSNLNDKLKNKNKNKNNKQKQRLESQTGSSSINYTGNIRNLRNKNVAIEVNRLFLCYLFILILIFDILAPFATDVCNAILPQITKYFDAKNDETGSSDNDIFGNNSNAFYIQLSLILFTLGHSIGQILFTCLSDYISYSMITFIGVIVYVGSCVLIIFSINSFMFLCARALQAIASGFAVLIAAQLSTIFYPQLSLLFNYSNLNSTNKGNINNVRKISCKQSFCLLFLSSIRSIIGVVSAAPIGAISIQCGFGWKIIFYCLILVVLMAALMTLPLLWNMIFTHELTSNTNIAIRNNFASMDSILAEFDVIDVNKRRQLLQMLAEEKSLQQNENIISNKDKNSNASNLKSKRIRSNTNLYYNNNNNNKNSYYNRGARILTLGSVAETGNNNNINDNINENTSKKIDYIRRRTQSLMLEKQMKLNQKEQRNRFLSGDATISTNLNLLFANVNEMDANQSLVSSIISQTMTGNANTNGFGSNATSNASAPKLNDLNVNDSKNINKSNNSNKDFNNRSQTPPAVTDKIRKESKSNSMKHRTKRRLNKLNRSLTSKSMEIEYVSEIPLQETLSSFTKDSLLDLEVENDNLNGNENESFLPELPNNDMNNYGNKVYNNMFERQTPEFSNTRTKTETGGSIGTITTSAQTPTQTKTTNTKTNVSNIASSENANVATQQQYTLTNFTTTKTTPDSKRGDRESTKTRELSQSMPPKHINSGMFFFFSGFESDLKVCLNFCFCLSAFCTLYQWFRL